MSTKEQLEQLTDALLSDDNGISEESYDALLGLYDVLGVDPDFDESVEASSDGRYYYRQQSEDI
jgi:hypothetical protein